MKQYHEMNVTEFVKGLQADWYDSVLDQLGCVTAETSEFHLLSQLDIARKSFDVDLATEITGPQHPLDAAIKRIMIGSLRKYAQPIRLKGATQLNNYSITCLTANGAHEVDPISLTWETYSRILESNAIEGFIKRDREVQWKLPSYLSSLMRPFLKRALSGFSDEFWRAPGHFGPGAVNEGFPIFARWDLLGMNPKWHRFAEDYALEDLPSSSEVRLCAVDKDWNKKRLITVEPYENTYLQHKVRHALSRTLVLNGLAKLASESDSHIDIPAVHRGLCLESSEYASRTSRIDTMDLSDASDGISWESIVDVFPLEVVLELERARTPSFRAKRFGVLNKENSLSGFDEIVPASEETISMRIYAGMGNATTFLVEGLYFYALLQAASEYYRIPNRKARDISVFGDDLITPTGYHELYQGVLKDAGLALNVSKSFCGTSPVRESCGMWAYKGQNLYALPFRGYSRGGTGALGFAEYIRNASFITRDLCLEYVKDWPNTDKVIPNTISVVDSSRPVNWELSRYSSKLCATEWHVKTAHSSHRFHLCVRRGGACMMIARVPSQEGISETVPLIEVLSQRGFHVESHLGKVVQFQYRSVTKSSPRKRQRLATSIDDGPENFLGEILITRELLELCQFIGRYQNRSHERTASRAMIRLLNLRSKVLKPRTKEEREALVEFRNKLSASRSNIPSLRLSLLGRVGVLKEAIPHSTTLRSSWVSNT